MTNCSIQNKRPILVFIIPVILIFSSGCVTEIEMSHEPTDVAESAVLITIDTHRGDHLGFMGNPDIRTPAMDRLSQQSTIFTESYTNLPLTLPAHSAMMTSKHPREIGVEENTHRLNTQFVTLAEILKTNDFATAAYPEAVLKFPRGLERGFDEYHGRHVKQQRSEDFRITTLLSMHQENGIEEKKSVVSQALKWIETKNNSMKRYFLWMHFFDPHIPYNPPKPFEYIDQVYPKEDIDLSIRSFYDYERNPDKDYPLRVIDISRVLYRNEIFYVDTMLEKFFRHVLSQHSSRPAIIITSDHGESLHKKLPYFGHGFHVTREELHVPFLVYSGDNQGRIISDVLVESVDVAPTILNALDVPGLPSFQGFNVLGQNVSKTRLLPFSIGSPPNFAGAMNLQYKVVKDLNAHEWNYWDRNNDPGELYSRPVNDEAPEDVIALQAFANKYLNMKPISSDDVPVEEDPEYLEFLKSLGYIQ